MCKCCWYKQGRNQSTNTLKLVGLHEALEKNFDWIVPENPFDESSEPKSVHKGSSKTHLDIMQFIVEKTSAIDLNASFENT